MIGGVQHVDASGTKVRGEPHMLLVGDPGINLRNHMLYRV
jgi:DNA helicase MCM9